VRILALETATPSGSVALLDGDSVLERTFDPRGAGTIVTMGEVLAEAGCTPGQVDAVAASVGPGSFTGVRIGVAAAAGFCRATGARAVPVGTLEGIAWAARESDWGVPETWILASVDARRGEVYAALYRVSDRVPVRKWGPEAISCAELATRFAGSAADVKVEQGVLAGDGAALLAELFPDDAGWASPIVLSKPRAGAVARAAKRILEEGGGVPPEQLLPVYLRKSDAEVVRETRIHDA
jgi:tRNA threonylcarbamoyladenosine biosynthesis protein TsaB